MRLAKAVAAQASGQGAKVFIDFSGLLPFQRQPNITIWHDTADDCGTLCDESVAFLRSVAEVESARDKKTPGLFRVQPRFLFQPCPYPNTANSTLCQEYCTPSGRCADVPAAVPAAVRHEWRNSVTWQSSSVQYFFLPASRYRSCSSAPA